MDKCQYCGREENPMSSNPDDHCVWVGEFAERLKGVRSPSCYETELAAKDALLRECEGALSAALCMFKVTQTVDDYPLDHWSRQAQALLPKIQEAVEEKR